ncbi:fumarylacetoacetate hydrolase family protein [Herbiconiux sp.]|uniref:fumarylacetoacetate hydrolase family protein n=1 Tax=Herbiconiux sp. TaxID=1871186 RepID=UPI0025C2A0EE|nr:fumarylacetoacetate hydrolase family protein [Herbiconiux sp.]
MRVANLNGRAVLLGDIRALDIATAGAGRFPADPQRVYTSWRELCQWGEGIDVDRHPRAVDVDLTTLGPPVPRPGQILAVGLNYADHAAESGLELPEHPLVFTKFASSLTGPDAVVRLSGERVDWEAELVVVIGTGGRDIPAAEAWDRIAGLTIGQDISDRDVQWWGASAQFSLGKSFQGYAPTGPAVVSVAEISAGRDRDDLRVSCRSIDASGRERVLQDGRTRDMIFTIPAIIEQLSAIVELQPGDLVFTGTPAGVGQGRTPEEFLRPGNILVTEIDGLGSIRQEFV